MFWLVGQFCSGALPFQVVQLLLPAHLLNVLANALFGDMSMGVCIWCTLLKTRVNGATPAAAAADPTE